MKKAVALLILSSILLLMLVSYNTRAGEAGVGVLNVPPEYSSIRVLYYEDSIRIYLTISDYNSWEDIYQVKISLEDSGLEKARFVFKQYENTTSYDRINRFTEEVSNGILYTEKCSYSVSNKKDTVKDRCNMHLLFVFKTTYFTRIYVTAEDRGGEKAEATLDYDLEAMIRSGNIIMIPWINGVIGVEVPFFMINAIS